MTQYLLAVHHAELSYSDEEMARIVEAVEAFNADLQRSGSWVFAGGLAGPNTATVVDGTGPSVTMTDGPFLETKEHLGGFWVIEAADLDAALELAGRASKAAALPVEVRPFQDQP